MRSIDGICDICGEYDIFVMDVWGVIYDGIELFPNINDCLKNIKAQGKHIVLLSNSSRSEAFMFEMLEKAGLETSYITFIQTSGDTALSDLKNFFSAPSRKLYYISSNENKNMFKSMLIQLTYDVSSADAVAVSINMPEETDYSDLMGTLQQAADRKLPMFCLNGDRVALCGNRKIRCARFFADKYAELGGKVKFYGKPHKVVYDATFNRLNSLGLSTKCIMIGDSMETDILGAKNAYIDSVLVKTGVSANEFAKGSGASLSEEIQRRYEYLPTFLIDKLRWN
jgi:HAD superfamily hydrolase (TIGR01459 family)